MLYAYIFSLIVGGVLLAASLLLGGKDVHLGEGGPDADAGAGPDAHGLDDVAHGPGDVAHGPGDVAHAPGDLVHSPDDAGHSVGGGALAVFLSLRFWTFFLAFFGVTGVLMRGLALLPGELAPLGAALAMGSVAGLAVQWTVRRIASTSANSAVGVQDFIGKSATVVLPVARGDVGKVRVSLKGQEVEVIATTDDDAPLQTEEEVLVVEMREGTARVARVK